ncbi:IS3 family transposase [Alicyclobacillus acidocaldarius]|uniref:IS3 family transposase n=1 Tax=Alicyclobacillus acidocaldarius TaxID=405212 RepID=UPI0009DAD32D
MPGSTSTAPNFRFRRCAKSLAYLGAATTHGADGPKVFGAKRRKRRIRRIHELFLQSRRLYGSPKITALLRRDGERIAQKTVARLMREHGLRSRTVRKVVSRQVVEFHRACLMCVTWSALTLGNLIDRLHASSRDASLAPRAPLTERSPVDSKSLGPKPRCAWVSTTSPHVSIFVTGLPLRAGACSV